MAKISLSDGLVDVVEHGKGRPLLLLHSMLADRSAFDALIPALAGRRLVLAPDLPGFGGSSPGVSSISDIADRIASLCDVLELDEDTDVIGNGFGSFVALSLGIRHGQRFRRLVLAGGGARFSDAGRASFGVMAERVRAYGMEGVVEMAVKRLFPEDFIRKNPAQISLRKEALRKIDPAYFSKCCQMLIDMDFTSLAPGVKNPVTIVVGLLDLATPPEMARELAGLISDVRVIELPGCGHAPMIQSPKAFIDSIAEPLSLEIEEQ